MLKNVQQPLPSILHEAPSSMGRECKPASSGERVTLPSSNTKHGIPGEDYPTFEEIMSQVPDIIYETNLMLVISRNKKKGQTYDIDWDGSISHILVGADMLNRGGTVERLAVTYMPRHSVGKSTADTIQQRCRFLGYKRNYLYSCRVYLPEDTALEYREYVDHEEEMRK